MSLSSEAAQAAAAKMAASLGVTDMSVEEISRMLELKHALYPMFQVSVAFLVLTWLAVSLRIYARAVVIKSFGWDDWLMLVTLAVFSSCCACLIAIEDIEKSYAAQIAVANGLLAEFPIMQRIFRLVMAFMALYVVTTVILKLSLAIFFLRVIPNGWQRKVLYLATGIYTTYGVVFTFIVVFQCGNPNDFFLQEARGKCISDSVLQPLYYTAGGMNALTDWIFSILPVTVIWNAAIPRTTKISAGCLLGLGSLASISSLIRLAYIPGIQASPTFLEHAVNIASWSIVEPGLGIMAASLATLRPLFRYCFPGKRSTVLPTTHKGKPITYTPGTYMSRMSFEDKINPYGDLQMGCVTTIVGNSKDDGTELAHVGRKGHQKNLSNIEEAPTHSRTASAGTDVSRVDSAGPLERTSSQKSLMRHEQFHFPRPPTATRKASNGRVVMFKDFRMEQEVSISRSQASSPV